MLNHYELQKLAEMKEAELRKRADRQWMFESGADAENAASRPKGILKRIMAAIAAMIA